MAVVSFACPATLYRYDATKGAYDTPLPAVSSVIRAGGRPTVLCYNNNKQTLAAAPINRPFYFPVTGPTSVSMRDAANNTWTVTVQSPAALQQLVACAVIAQAVPPFPALPLLAHPMHTGEEGAAASAGQYCRVDVSGWAVDMTKASPGMPLTAGSLSDQEVAAEANGATLGSVLLGMRVGDIKLVYIASPPSSGLSQYGAAPVIISVQLRDISSTKTGSASTLVGAASTSLIGIGEEDDDDWDDEEEETGLLALPSTSATATPASTPLSLTSFATPSHSTTPVHAQSPLHSSTSTSASSDPQTQDTGATLRRVIEAERAEREKRAAELKDSTPAPVEVKESVKQIAGAIQELSRAHRAQHVEDVRALVVSALQVAQGAVSEDKEYSAAQVLRLLKGCLKRATIDILNEEEEGAPSMEDAMGNVRKQLGATRTALTDAIAARDAHIQRQQEALEWKGEPLDEAISNAPSSSATQASGNIGFTAKAVVSSSPAVSTQPQAVAAIHSTGAVAPVTVAAKEIANSTPISQKKAVQEKTVQASIPEASTPKSKAASRKKGRRRVGDLEPPPQVVKRAENEESPLFALESSGGNLFGEPEPEADISFEIKGKISEEVTPTKSKSFWETEEKEETTPVDPEEQSIAPTPPRAEEPKKVESTKKPTTKGGDGPTSHWINEDTVDKCMNCDVEFGFFTRKHHCRSCGNVMCDKCTKKEAFVPQYKQKGRVCDFCYDNLKTMASMNKKM